MRGVNESHHLTYWNTGICMISWAHAVCVHLYKTGAQRQPTRKHQSFEKVSGGSQESTSLPVHK